MIILLDIDGVLVTTPSWRPAEIDADGFLKFNATAADNLNKILAKTNAAVVLTTTHRVNYTVDEWTRLLQTRNIIPSSISKINDASKLSTMKDRATEVSELVDRYGSFGRYVIIDDDTSLNRLSQEIKDKTVLTKSMVGLDQESTDKALSILLGGGI